MALTSEKKGGILAQFRRGPADTGSPEVQVALLSERINGLGGAFRRTQARSFLAARAGEARQSTPQAPRLSQIDPTAEVPGARRATGTSPLNIQGPRTTYAALVFCSQIFPGFPLRGLKRERCQQVISLRSPHRHHRDRRDGPPGRGAVRVSMGDTVVLVTACAAQKARRRARLLPSDRQLRREDLCRGPHPGRLLQA